MDVGRKMREYWDAENINYFNLLNMTVMYPGRSDAFCEASLYQYINDICDEIIEDAGAETPERIPTKQQKADKQFKYDYLGTTDINTSPVPAVVMQSTSEGKLFLLECRSNYYAGSIELQEELE